MREKNIGNKWAKTLKLTSQDEELFAVYESELPLLTQLYDEYVFKNELDAVNLGDFGGGNGKVTEYIKNHKRTDVPLSVTCFDVNEELLLQNLSADTRVVTDLSNINTICEFDIALMRYVINYNSNVDRIEIIKRIHASLKNGGVFINWWCGVSDQEHEKKFKRLFGTKEINEKLFRPSSNWLTWREDRVFFENAGFDIEVMKEFSIPIENMFKNRYELSEAENHEILEYLGEYNFISYVIFKAFKS